MLLVDDPSIGLEARYVEILFTMLAALQHREGKSILKVEQNAHKRLTFAKDGSVPHEQVAMTASAKEALLDPSIRQLFPGALPRYSPPLENLAAIVCRQARQSQLCPMPVGPAAPRYEHHRDEPCAEQREFSGLRHGHAGRAGKDEILITV